jgi:hypothetical protein
MRLAPLSPLYHLPVYAPGPFITFQQRHDLLKEVALMGTAATPRGSSSANDWGSLSIAHFLAQ